MTSKRNLYLGIHSPRTLRTRSAVFLAPNPLQDVRPVEVALTAGEQEIAGQSLTTANLGRIRKAYVDRSGRCGTASMPSVRHLSKRTLEFCDEQEPHRNRPWGGGRDRRVRSAPVNFKER